MRHLLDRELLLSAVVAVVAVVVEVPIFMFKVNCLSFLLLSFLQVSCGEYTTNYVKDYNIFVQSEDDEINDTIRALADQYNNDFGAEAISIVDDEDDSNSRIGFISGLKSRENKLGLGQWITMTSEEGRDLVPSASGSNLQKTVVYSMELAFDLQNFRQKMSSRETRSGGDWNHLYHLFCHEVGHGLQMRHQNNIKSVMYRSIPDQSREGVDYDDYFDMARAFFRD